MSNSPFRLIKTSITELKSLNVNNTYAIAKINWWLLKHYNLYKYCKVNWNNGSCFGELPCNHTMGAELDNFRHFYEGLEEVADLHKQEPYFQEQMQDFENVRNDNSALIKWLLQNEELGIEDFLLFWIEWLCEDGIVNPGITYFPEINIRIRAKEFESTIQFLEVFNERYWTSGLYKDE